MINNSKLIRLISFFLFHTTSANFLGSMDLDNSLNFNRAKPIHTVEIQIFVENAPSEKDFKSFYLTRNPIPSVSEAYELCSGLEPFIDELPYNTSLWISFKRDERIYDPMYGEIFNLNGEKTFQYYKWPL